jgi:hypothetical protein
MRGPTIRLSQCTTASNFRRTRPDASLSHQPGSNTLNWPMHHLKHLVIAACTWFGLLGVSTAVLADPVWLTILGNPLDPMSDAVQVDVTSAVAFETARVVTLRANRAKDRMARDGKPFRSYVSSVLIDCDTDSARHRVQDLYAGPLWTGAMRTARYNDNDIRRMAFQDMEANPKDRIIRAACAINLVKSK